MRAIALLLLLLSQPVLAGNGIVLEGLMEQSALIRGRAPPGTEITLDGHAVRVAADGAFVFGFGRDHPPLAVLDVRYADGGSEQRELAVAARTYDVQRIDGLKQNLVTPDPVELARIRRENAAVAQVRTIDSAAPLFQSGFIWPVSGPISSVYGSQRILNGEPRQPHFGIDIVAPAGTPVHASTDGLVVMAEPDLLLTGGTIILDHGFGLSGAYSHMSKLLVKVGDHVRQGDVIGLVGATGRVTAAHLDWRINWFDQRLDPALIAGPMRTN